MSPIRPDVAHPEALDPATRRLLGAFATLPESDAFYLAGSAALALHLDHRPVRDADLMAATNRLAPAERRDLLQALLAIDPALRVETARDGFLATRSGDGPRLRFFYYPYPLAEPLGSLGELDVASAVDLGLMKLGAVISRGTRRDFLDLYLLCRRLPLDELFERAADKFGHVGDFPLQALKGLADHRLAADPMPRLRHPVAWEEVEAWLDGEVRRGAAARLAPPD